MPEPDWAGRSPRCFKQYAGPSEKRTANFSRGSGIHPPAPRIWTGWPLVNSSLPRACCLPISILFVLENFPKRV